MSRYSHQIATWLIFILIAGGYFIMARYFPFAYIVATYEDLVGEWAQVVFFATTMLLAIRHAIRTERFRLFFSVLALACFYVVGEEISWGQRLFDLSTPEFFREHNLQKETNLHNFLTGPISTWIKSTLEYSIATGLVFYGLLYPLALNAKYRWAEWLEQKGLPGPPLFLWPFFLLSAFLELGPFGFNEAEVAEILIPAALSVMLLFYLAAQKHQHPLRGAAPLPASLARKLAATIFLLFVCVGLLAAGTTWACYLTPHLKEKIENRYLNGVEKFAGRYKRFELWEKAIDLYQHTLQLEPGRASLHRELYRCYLPLGKMENMQQHIEQAIRIDQSRLENNPDSITAHVSMARNYRLIGDAAAATEYLQRGLVVATAKQQRQPDSSSTAYWLGKIHQLLGRPGQAYAKFKKAVELKPNNLKYRKALMSLKNSGYDPEETDDS